MFTPRIKPFSLFPEEAPEDLVLVRRRKAKLEGYVQTFAAMDKLIDFSEMAAAVDAACPRADRSKGWASAVPHRSAGAHGVSAGPVQPVR
ncbi:hypothetical protein [Ideonella alba]|uniref:hypothetical protein n=1 Tax=Ideonella alba TaxID=2824118 RepID=UPI001FFC34EA|nr:hypothetical protein [Ideonella alba]